MLLPMVNFSPRGELDNTRVISLAGPAAKNPRLVRTVLGASTAELTAGEAIDGELRVVSGSLLMGVNCSSRTRLFRALSCSNLSDSRRS